MSLFDDEPEIFREALRPYGVTRKEAEVARLLRLPYAVIGARIGRSRHEVRRRADNLRRKLKERGERADTKWEAMESVLQILRAFVDDSRT